jgi:peptidoglycan/LPS O-acetylase OafA/YrhL
MMSDEFEIYKDLEMLNLIKFLQEFLIMINLTASLLNLASAENPWSMESQFSNPTVMLVLLGVTAVDGFFTISSFLAFFKIHQFFKRQKQISMKSFILIYMHRLLKFLPTLYLVLFFGIYVMPYFNTN